MAFPRRYAHASGYVGFVLGAIGALAALCFVFPEHLTTPALRAVYPVGLIRTLVRIVLVSAWATSAIDLVVRRSPRSVGGAGLVLAATGSLLLPFEANVKGPIGPSSYLGVDWFLIDLVVMAGIFGALETFFARRVLPPWDEARRTDFTYFAVGHLLVQLVAFLAIAPAQHLFAWAALSSVAHAVASQPLALQAVEVVVVADLTQYAWHRLAHRVPFLWRIHSVHHSAERMDWLAGSRLHLLDVVFTRAILFVPIFVLGFAPGAIAAYLVFVSFHAVFIHADIAVRFTAVERLVVTPRYHHWHHAIESEAIDTNFALHLPVLDRLFGTQRLPNGGEWPSGYGIANAPVPRGYLAQLAYPFVTRRV